MQATLRWVFDDEYGIYGYKLKGVNVYGALSITIEGMLIAHDLIEHVNGLEAIGSVHDELEAFGAMWYVRGQTGTFRKNDYHPVFSVQESLGHDLLNLYEYFLRNNGFNVPIPVVKKDEYDYFEDDFKSAIKFFKQKARDIEANDYEDRPTAEYRRLRKEYIKGCKRWLRSGHRKAVKRYKDNYDHAWSVFWGISDVIDEKLKYFDTSDEYCPDLPDLLLHYTLNGSKQPYIEEIEDVY